jgi:hypothetical protein
MAEQAEALADVADNLASARRIAWLVRQRLGDLLRPGH